MSGARLGPPSTRGGRSSKARCFTRLISRNGRTCTSPSNGAFAHHPAAATLFIGAALTNAGTDPANGNSRAPSSGGAANLRSLLAFMNASAALTTDIVETWCAVGSGREVWLQVRDPLKVNARAAAPGVQGAFRSSMHQVRCKAVVWKTNGATGNSSAARKVRRLSPEGKVDDGGFRRQIRPRRLRSVVTLARKACGSRRFSFR